ARLLLCRPLVFTSISPPPTRAPPTPSTTLFRSRLDEQHPPRPRLRHHAQRDRLHPERLRRAGRAAAEGTERPERHARRGARGHRSEEYTSELQSVSNSYAVFCLNRKSSTGQTH